MVLGSVPDYLATTPLTGAGAEPFFVENNGFFPRVSLEQFETECQVDASYARERRIAALRWAVGQVNDDLSEQACIWVCSGYHTLASVPQDALDVDAAGDDLQSHLHWYTEAVFAKAMQRLNHRYRGTDTKQYAVPKAAAMEEAADSYELDYRRAIYALTGRHGQIAYVELL